MAEWVVEGFEDPCLQIEVSQVVIHKANQPDIIVHFFDADRLAGEDSAEINPFVTETDPAPIGDDNDVVEEIIDIGQSLMGRVEADRARPDSKPLFSSPSKNQRLWKYGADE